MKSYMIQKNIEAKPMSRIDYYALRGWDLDPSEEPLDAGYLVHDTTSGEYSNMEGFDGYIVWLPAKFFEANYRESGNMTFGQAVEALKVGDKVARAGWNGRGMYVRNVRATADLNQHFELFNTSGTFDTWVASISDTLAEDWSVVNE